MNNSLCRVIEVICASELIFIFLTTFPDFEIKFKNCSFVWFKDNLKFDSFDHCVDINWLHYYPNSFCFKLLIRSFIFRKNFLLCSLRFLFLWTFFLKSCRSVKEKKNCIPNVLFPSKSQNRQNTNNLFKLTQTFR
jgi:hypothetical protein